MGKATINSAIGDGRYNVTINFDRTRSDAEILRLEVENTAIDARIVTLEVEITDAYDAESLANSVLNTAISGGDKPTINAAQENLVKKQRTHSSLLTVKNIIKLKKLGNEKRIAWLQDNVPGDQPTTAWCADYNTSLSGEVGTIDIGRESGTNIIKPGGTDGTEAAYVAADDGKYEPLQSHTPSGAYYNLASLPGIEKWKPRFRTGTITAMSGTTCDITLDAAVSTSQLLDINQTSTLSSVSFSYMDCDEDAFDVSDHVVIEFVDMGWSTPQVVGFVDNPVECQPKWVEDWLIPPLLTGTSGSPPNTQFQFKTPDLNYWRGFALETWPSYPYYHQVPYDPDSSTAEGSATIAAHYDTSVPGFWADGHSLGLVYAAPSRYERFTFTIVITWDNAVWNSRDVGAPLESIAAADVRIAPSFYENIVLDTTKSEMTIDFDVSVPGGMSQSFLVIPFQFSVSAGGCLIGGVETSVDIRMEIQAITGYEV